ncbi:MAG: hypothetical protein K8R48_08590 [Alphaproteobacteria bacterium]|nr:hypothetical protein [Alphaproteobacteria bacterium]
MWPFDIASRKAFKKAQARDQLFKRLKEAAETGDRPRIFDSVHCLLHDHLGDALLPAFLAATVDTLKKKDPSLAIDVALYTIGTRDYQDENKNAQFKKIQLAVAEKSFEAMALADKSNPGEMAGVAMLAGVVTKIDNAGSATEARALRQWAEAMDVLAAKDMANYATAAASNAACGLGSRALSELATEKWEKTLTTLATTDKATAATLAKFFAQKCEEFEAPFKQRASALAQKLS